MLFENSVLLGVWKNFYWLNFFFWRLFAPIKGKILKKSCKILAQEL